MIFCSIFFVCGNENYLSVTFDLSSHYRSVFFLFPLTSYVCMTDNIRTCAGHSEYSSESRAALIGRQEAVKKKRMDVRNVEFEVVENDANVL